MKLFNRLICPTTIAVFLSACGGSGGAPSNDDGSNEILDPIAPAEVVEPSVVEPPVVEPPVVDPPVVDQPEVVQPDEVVVPPEEVPPVSLIPDETISSFVNDEEIINYIVSNITSIILVSEAGDADLRVFDEDDFLTCSSTSSAPLDFCSNLDSNTTYNIQIFGFSEADFLLRPNSTPAINGRNRFTNEVAENIEDIYIANGITAVNLTSLNGDADLVIRNTELEIICDSNRSTDFDSCNNVDGSVLPGDELDSNQTYIISVEGFTQANYSLQTFDTPVVLDGFDSVTNQFVGENEERSWFARLISQAVLFPFNSDVDLEIYDISTNELVCSSRLPFTEIDTCNMAFGSYRVTVYGFNEGFYDLLVN